jgi:ribosomal protein S18 acetylase RimI-like enzyme
VQHDHDHPASAASELLHDHGAAAPPVADASVRIARPADVPAVGLVQATVWRAAYSATLSPEVLEQFEGPAFARVWRASLATPPSPRHELLVACAGEQVVGFAAIGPSADADADDAQGELLALGVHPQARRAGHGSRLLNAAVDTLRGRQFTRLSGWVLADDEATRAFLVGSGLSPDGAYRDRVVDPDGTVVREVRLVADLATA